MQGVIAIDWGTSAFRLWVMGSEGVLARSRGPEGMKYCLDTGFAPVLAHHLARAHAPPDWPILICGMAGARGAWAEVPYIPLPAPVEALAAGALRLPPDQAGDRDIRILPGLANRDPARPDVMRGEETQLLGLARSGYQGLICMPGTHCKWADLRGGTVTGFQSFMTGELFQLLATQSTLRLSLATNGEVSPADPAFLRAVHEALDDPALLTEALFGVRAGGLLGYISAEDARARLSGLLIGTELGRILPRIGPDGVTLLGQEGLGALYHAALVSAGHQPRQADADTATKAGLWAAAKKIWSI